MPGYPRRAFGRSKPSAAMRTTARRRSRPGDRCGGDRGSDFHDHRDHRRRRLVRSLMNLPRDRRAWRRRVSKSAAPSTAASRRRRGPPPWPPRALLGFGGVDPAAGDDLGAGDQLAGGGVDGDDDNDQPLLREVSAVAQAHPVRRRRRCRRRRGNRPAPRPARPRWPLGLPAPSSPCAPSPACRRPRRSARGPRHAHLLGEARVVDHVRVLAVYRDEPLGLHDVDEQLQLSATCGPTRAPAIRRAAPRHRAVERVDDARDVDLVAGDRVAEITTTSSLLIFTCLCSCAAINEARSSARPAIRCR